MATLLIHGGRIIDPASDLDTTGDLLIDDGRVAAIETTPGALSRADADTAVDAEGLIVSPGLLDIHVHFREPHPAHEESIATGSASAVAGGFTTVCCMPNTTPALDTATMVRFVQHQGRAANLARVYTSGCATVDRKGEALAEIGTMAAAGAIAFTDDGDCVADAGLFAKVLASVATTGRPFMQHCQDPTLTRGGVMNAGSLATRLGLGGWPRIAEEIIIERDVRINRDIGCRYHAQHVSSGGSVEILARARAAGLPVSGEVSPHHLLLTEEACAEYDTMAKMNPPLRGRRDIDLLKLAVADGTIDVLATDHAPHPLETKRTDFTSASFGIVGLDCALPLYAKALIHGNVIPWRRMLAMMTINPARLVGLDAVGLGSLAVDGPADVTLIDPDLEWTIDASAFASTGRNCPFDGWTVRGRAVGTIVSGDVKLARGLDARGLSETAAAASIP